VPAGGLSAQGQFAAGGARRAEGAGHAGGHWREALRNRSYVLLGLGFFVCGFHVAFLATHLPGVIAACGLPTQWAGWSLAMIGLFNIVGSVAMGWAVGRWRMKSLLSLVYATRAWRCWSSCWRPRPGRWCWCLPPSWA
jgi:hypothetical protein